MGSQGHCFRTAASDVEVNAAFHPQQPSLGKGTAGPDPNSFCNLEIGDGT